jgi:hypothetical protein
MIFTSSSGIVFFESLLIYNFKSNNELINLSFLRFANSFELFIIKFLSFRKYRI